MPSSTRSWRSTLERQAAGVVAKHDVGRRHGVLERLEPEPGPHQLDAGDLANEGARCSGGSSPSLSIQCSAWDVVVERTLRADREPGIRVVLDHDGVSPDEGPHGRAAVVGDQVGRARGQHLGGGLGMVQAQQATEGLLLSPSSVQPYGAQHGGPRPFHVLAPGGDPSPHDFGEQGMDPVAREPVGRPVGYPGHHQPGGLESSARVAAASGVTGRCRAASTATLSLVGHAQQQVAVLGRKRGEHLRRDGVGDGDSWSRRRRAATRGHASRRGSGRSAPPRRTTPACAR